MRYDAPQVTALRRAALFGLLVCLVGCGNSSDGGVIDPGPAEVRFVAVVDPGPDQACIANWQLGEESQVRAKSTPSGITSDRHVEVMLSDSVTVVTLRTQVSCSVAGGVDVQLSRTMVDGGTVEERSGQCQTGSPGPGGTAGCQVEVALPSS